MLLQSNKTLPPTVAPDFEALAIQARSSAIPNEWIKVPAMRISVGLDDPENENGPDRYFGWDNEKPERQQDVTTFEAQARPLSNEDYAYFLEQTAQDTLPASWTFESSKAENYQPDGNPHTSGDPVYSSRHSSILTDEYLRGKSVRTVYGPVPLRFALDWPVFASYDELAGCAAWMNGRIPTAEEVRSIYHYVNTNRNRNLDSILARKISAVNGQVHTSF